MTKRLLAAVIAAVVLVGGLGLARAAAHGEKAPQKTAILLVAFGTSVPEARKAFDEIEARVKKAFPNAEVRWAFTSKIIRRKQAKQGEKLDSPALALAKLQDEGYGKIVVASFHSLPGEEFHDLHRDVQAFRQMTDAEHRKIVLSRPLLSSRQNMVSAAKAVLAQVPSSRKPADAVVLMGHGSEHHPGDAVYAALAYFCEDIDPNMYIGTVEGQIRLEDILPKLKAKKTRTVYLMPLMAVAGDHARNDMCGDDAESWKSILEKAGFQVKCVLKGTAEIPEVVDVWLGNIRRAYARLK
jgi:sirohydrochlorin cobaltochelatase